MLSTAWCGTIYGKPSDEIPGDEMAKQLIVGSTVRVPWGLEDDIEGTVIEVWGDPPLHVRVQLHLPEAEDDAEPVVILLAPSALTAA